MNDHNDDDHQHHHQDSNNNHHHNDSDDTKGVVGRTLPSSSMEERKTEVDDPYGSTDDHSLTYYSEGSNSRHRRRSNSGSAGGSGGSAGGGGRGKSKDNQELLYQPRRWSTRSIKPVKAFRPTSPEDPAVKATLAKSRIDVQNSSSSSTSDDDDDDDGNNNDDNDDSSTGDDESLSSTPGGQPKTANGRFLLSLYDFVESCHLKSPEVVCWSDDGSEFIINPDHKRFIQIINDLGYRSLASFHRQLNYYGWKKTGLNNFSNPVFFRGVKPKYFDLIRRREAPNFIPFSRIVAKMKKNGDYIKSFEANGRSVAASASKKLYDDDVDDDEDDDDDEDATHHGGDDEEKETAIKQRDRSGSFPRKVWAMINAVEKTHPDILRWEKDGEAFYIDKDHAKITQILRKHMKLSNYRSIHRRLNKHGWSKPQHGRFVGLFYHPVFSRNMADELFDVITPGVGSSCIDGQLKEARRIKAKLSLERKESKSKGNSEFPSSKTGTKTKKRRSSDADQVNSQQDHPAKKAKSGDNSGSSPAPLTERQLVDDRLKKYKKIKQRYNHWTVWSIPPDLKNLLVTLKVNVEREGDDDEDVNYSSLLCREKMPLWFNDRTEYSVSDFEDRVVHDQKQREADAGRQDKIAPPKGKALPSSKFNTPTNKWLNVKVGDRVDIFWSGDDTYYSASITKQQARTSYFFLIYDEDGQSEWLDLSREEFEVLHDAQEHPVEVSARDSRHGIMDRTPRKDNRSTNPGGDHDNVFGLPANLSHLAPYVRYNWDGIEMDCCSSLSLNDTKMQQNGHGNIEQSPAGADISANHKLTALDILHDVQSLRQRTGILPPSELTRLLDSRETDPMSSDTAASTKNKRLVALLRKIRDEVSTTADTTPPTEAESSSVTSSSETPISLKVAAMRRLTNKWTKQELVRNMMRVDNQISLLSKKEDSIMEKLRAANLL